MSRVSSSYRCETFERLASQTWEKVKKHRRHGINPHEDGITNDLITEIRNEYAFSPNFGVWADRGHYEDTFGTDIDLFVESFSGEFVWYALQAKSLKPDGTYNQVCKRSHDEYQWEKLSKLEKLAGCITYYVLYNGDDNYTVTGLDKCNRLFREDQFGCSLVKPDVMKAKCLRKTEAIVFCENPEFKDFHDAPAQPWRILTCCLQPSGAKTYTLEQIRKYADRYDFRSSKLPRGFDPQVKDESVGSENANEIVNIAKELALEPKNIILFRRSS